jgi:predicted double-glycine peptidase
MAPQVSVWIRFVRSAAILAVVALPAGALAADGAAALRPAQVPAAQPLTVLDVPFISQSEALCGGAAAAMVLRYWGERELQAESFAHLVDRSAAGIRTDVLIAELRRRGWDAIGLEGTRDLLTRELAGSRPVVTLVEDRPGAFHYVVVVASAARAVVFHDPARLPFRVMPWQEFERRWSAADRWMAVVVPRRAPEGDVSTAGGPVEAPAVGRNECGPLVSDGVRLAQAGDLDAAERGLSAALSCPGALRELAGVRLLQRRWPEVVELASAALEEAPSDAHAWRLLATGRFVQNDRAGALDAWNHAGEPRVDLITVTGLTRTRQRVVETLIDVDPGTVLTRERLERAARRLAELPSASSGGRVEYVPVPSGLVEVRAAVPERPVVPTGWPAYAALGLRAAVRREIVLPISAPSGGGERLDASWRFWRNRPLAGAAIEAPAPWGVWSLAGSWERQPFDTAAAPAERRSVTVSTSSWLTSRLRLAGRGGVDRWQGSRAHPFAGARFELVGGRDEAAVVSVGFDAITWAREGFSMAAADVGMRSRTDRRGFVLLGRGGIGAASARTPLDLWFGGDTGHARPIPLRAHPLLDDEGRLIVERLSRRVLHASVEAQRWWRAPAAVSLAAAAFVDSVRLARRAAAAPTGDVDVGVGARLALPGVRGTFRLDAARGLRDGATALSVAYQVEAR